MNIPRTTAKTTLHTEADILFIIAPFLTDNGRSCRHSGIRSTSKYRFIILISVPAVNEKHTENLQILYMALFRHPANKPAEGRSPGIVHFEANN